MQKPDLSRRKFVHTSAAASALAISGNLIPTPVHAAPENTIKLGLIGCGGRGTGAAAQAMNAGDEIKLVAVCDVDRSAAEQQVALLAKQKKDQVTVPPDRIFSGFDDYKTVINSSTTRFSKRSGKTCPTTRPSTARWRR